MNGNRARSAANDTTARDNRAPTRRYVRQADLLLDLIPGDRTRRSSHGLHSRLASDSADDSVFAERMLMPGSGCSCRWSWSTEIGLSSRIPGADRLGTRRADHPILASCPYRW